MTPTTSRGELKNDDLSFLEAHYTGEGFKNCLIQLNQGSYIRLDTRRVVRDLRFLVLSDGEFSNNPKPPRYFDHESPTAYMPECHQAETSRFHSAASKILVEACNCDKLKNFPYQNPKQSFSSKNPILRLTELGELPCAHFLAVSYCWDQSGYSSEKSNYPMSYRIETRTGPRRNCAPANILRRAIEYASERGFKCIWIDQECIDQDDERDKELHIQAMDAIYKAARQVIAILNTPISPGDLMEAFQHDLRSKQRTANQRFMYAYNCLFRIGKSIESDLWFTRAWTHQESMVAAGPVQLLIPCTINDIKPSWMGFFKNQVILDQFALFRTHGISSPLNAWCPTYKSPFVVSKDTSTHRLGCLDAWSHSQDLGLSNPFDRIAIVANLCGYQHRLDADSIELKRIHVPTAIFLQALLNGDVSLLLAISYKRQPVKRGSGSATAEISAFSWCRLSPETLRTLSWMALSQGMRFTLKEEYRCRIAPPTLSSEGLLCSEYLFSFRLVDFGNFSWCGSCFGQFRPKFEEYPPTMVVNIVWQIIRAVAKEGLIALAKAVYVEASSLYNPFPIPLNIDPLLHSELLRTHLDSPVKRNKRLGPGPADPCHLGWLLQTIVHSSRWYIGHHTRPDISSRMGLAAFFLSPSKFAEFFGYQSRGMRIFVPQRIRTEPEGAQLNRLAFWDVTIIRTNEVPMRLRSQGDIRLLAWKGTEDRSKCFFWRD